MKKILIIFTLFSPIVLGFTLNAQQILDCPVDSTTNLELKIQICPNCFENNPDSILYSAFVKEYGSHEDCATHSIDIKTNIVKSYIMKPIDYSVPYVEDEYDIDSFTCNLNKIKSLEIIVRGVPGYPIRFNLNEFDPINNIELPQLKTLKLNTRYDDYIVFDFSKWSVYKGVLKSQTLEEITVEGHIMHKNWFAPFLNLKNLKIINITEHLSTELLELPKDVSELDFPNLYYFFSHHITDFPNLTKMPSFYERYDYNRLSDYYPEITFFGNAFSPTTENHPFYDINNYLEDKEQIDTTFSGKIELNNSDLYRNSIDSIDSIFSTNYIIASGQVKNGKPVGVWKYKIHDFIIFDKDSWYFYNYSFDSINKPLPKNGNWTYFYPDSTVAISGHLNKGLKEGEWKFYNPDGTLESVKSYKNGRPKGLFIDYFHFLGTDHESRRYFFSLNSYISGAKTSEGQYIVVKFNYDGYINNKIGKEYSLDIYGQLHKIKDGKQVREIKKGTLKYNRIIKGYLKKLYPEKKLSIKDLHFENK